MSPKDLETAHSTVTRLKDLGVQQATTINGLECSLFNAHRRWTYEHAESERAWKEYATLEAENALLRDTMEHYATGGVAPTRRTRPSRGNAKGGTNEMANRLTEGDRSLWRDVIIRHQARIEHLEAALATIRTSCGQLREALSHAAVRWAGTDLPRIERLEAALTTIRVSCGQVCQYYERCTHASCRSSHRTWHLANEALQ